jgi:two-component system, NtrC family, sensor kinase
MATKEKKTAVTHDFKGLGFSKIGHFKEVRSKIKELEKLNIKLAQRHNRLEAIFNSMSDGVTILDRNMTIVFANQIQKKMFPEINLIGEHCFFAYYRKNKICRDCPALKTLESQEFLRGEILVNTGNYKGRYLEWATSPIQNQFGKVEEIILLMRDITARKENEFKFMQADRMAAVGFLAAGIAHEINNPLTSIAGFSEGLLKRLKKIEKSHDKNQVIAFREYLEIINSEAYRCKEIIQNLQEFSRSSEGDYETISIDKIINATISLFRQHAKDSNIRISLKNQLTKGFNQVLGKESQLKHVFLNLFNTSFKAMEKGGELTLIARNDGSWIEVLICETGSLKEDVQDTGCQEVYTQPDFIGNSTAIDLSICYSIIQHHRGDLRAENIPGHGARYVLKFPAILD